MLLNKDLEIVEGTINQAIEISKQIPELDNPYKKSEYDKRLTNRVHLILIAILKGEPAGFKVGYQVDNHFYSWLGGVIPEFRRKNIASNLANYQQNWIQRNGFKSIKMKTRNKHKFMLQFALADGFNITGLEMMDDPEESRIFLDKEL